MGELQPEDSPIPLNGVNDAKPMPFPSLAQDELRPVRYLLLEPPRELGAGCGQIHNYFNLPTDLWN